jgi:hypothetical protein
MKAPYLLCFIVMLSCLMLTGRAAAQGNSYEPRTEAAEGTQLVAVYLGADWCGPCHLPKNKQAVKKMKTVFSEIADEHSWSFKAVGLALDWSIEDGYEFLQENGAFDEVILGDNWRNLGVETYIWSADEVQAAIPQVVVYKQEVNQTESGIEFGERDNVKRFSMEELRDWLEAGASWNSLSAIDN